MTQPERRELGPREERWIGLPRPLRPVPSGHFSAEAKRGVSDGEGQVIGATAGPPTSEGPTWIHGLKFLAARGGAPDPAIEPLVRLYARPTSKGLRTV